MYECFMYTLRAFFGYGIMRISLYVSVIIITLICVACSSGAFRSIVCKMRTKGGWRGIIAELGTGLFKLSILFLIARLLIVALNYQADVFQREHGRITERNRSAILMKWGSPHEQRELVVTHSRKRVWITRQLLLKLEDKKTKIYSETFWKDKPFPVRAVNNKMPSVISEKEEDRRVHVYQKSIISADVNISVKNNPRKLGNANYAGYDDTWNFNYIITNKSKWATTARVFFPLPAKTGFFNAMRFNIDGVNMLEQAKTEGNGIYVNIPMPSKVVKNVVIGFNSRGLEHLRYIPARMSRSGHYRITMELDGIPADKLDYPIGSMPPLEKLSDIKGSKYKLNWQLDDALTSYDVGIKLPDAKQPEYHFAALLKEAPIGLILLLLVLSLPAIIIGQKIRLEIIAVFSILYCLHFTLMGRLADLMTGFMNPFILSAIVILTIAFLFRLKQKKDSELLRYQDSVFFFAMIVFFPIVMISEYKDLWMQIFYLGVIAYIAYLTALQTSTRRE